MYISFKPFSSSLKFVSSLKQIFLLIKSLKTNSSILFLYSLVPIIKPRSTNKSILALDKIILFDSLGLILISSILKDQAVSGL